jgi:hypothetical protein
MGDAGKFFSKSEIQCPCGCGFIVINQSLIDLLDRVRLFLIAPLTFNSWCRCANHNADVGGKPDSEHLTGDAVDIAIPDDNYRARVLQFFFLFIGDLPVRLGIGKKFLHIGVAKDKPKEVVWLYD